MKPEQAKQNTVFILMVGGLIAALLFPFKLSYPEFAVAYRTMVISIILTSALFMWDFRVFQSIAEKYKKRSGRKDKNCYTK
ncbi:MAG: hypothetical protein ACOY4Q_12255 [Bacillota bacterium]